ncbi:hypothetical protein PIB30_022172 [Stylosanthes scabra]|uniref:Uncharacterized protein n=2 Tax=Stylosanthes scabra TaxID=79078 RepID=A0ABU6W8Y0_9FABA|nr:hypothetical protein [Stylosanthes scabra]
MTNSAKVRPGGMLKAVQEIGIYVHRFHNLDLFQQGWYQIKITMRWENNEDTSFGIPARVVQYEAPELGLGSVYGIWRIDDTDHSFSTQPFRIKYARQDIYLCMMISFNLPFIGFEGLPTTAVILKFELLYAPTFENGADLQSSLDAYPAAVHEFRIPPKALLGLHSYCPVHFDMFHAVLVDVSVHVSLLKATSSHRALKVPSNSDNVELVADKNDDTLDQDLGEMASVDLKNATLVKAFLSARDILLEELQKLNKVVDQPIDITELVSKKNSTSLLNSVLEANQFPIDVEQGKPQIGLEERDSDPHFLNVENFDSLSINQLLDYFHILGDQMTHLWNVFMKFHRNNKTKILEFLRDTWATDRKAEWSIWMVYTKVEMPPHIKNESDESSHQGGHRRVPSLLKMSEEPHQTAATRAELHRRSIAQMKINSRSIQDMHIFGDPSRIPIVIVERVMTAPRRTLSEDSYLSNIEYISSDSLQTELNSNSTDTKSTPRSNAQVLKIVVFVHGFQASLVLVEIVAK